MPSRDDGQRKNREAAARLIQRKEPASRAPHIALVFETTRRAQGFEAIGPTRKRGALRVRLRKRDHSLQRIARKLAFGLLIAGVSTVSSTSACADAAILVYHRFGLAAASTTVSDSALDVQLSWLAAHTRVGKLQAVVDGLKADNVNAPCVAVTVDDGHRSVFTDLFPRLLRYRLPATLFVYPSAISKADYALTWDQLREMAASGLVDVQSHTYWHPNFSVEKRRRTAQDYLRFVTMQLARSRAVIAKQIGRPVDMLAWPFGLSDRELGQAASNAGYVAGFLLGNKPVKSGSDPLALPRIWMSDGDRESRLAATVGTVCPRNRGFN